MFKTAEERERERIAKLRWVADCLEKNLNEGRREDYPRPVEQYIQQLFYEETGIDNLVDDLLDVVKSLRSDQKWVHRLAVRCAMDGKRYLFYNEWIPEERR